MHPIDVWYIPVIIPARHGALIAAVVKTLLNLTPWEASLSMFGVLMVLSP
jgi:hypothetical protein